MINFNPLKLGKYTFWVSFIIGNLFLFGFLFGVAIQNNEFAMDCAVCGFFYLYVASIINIVILLALLIWGIIDVGKRKQYFIGIGIMLINIPLAVLYAFIGLSLIDYFNL